MEDDVKMPGEISRSFYFCDPEVSKLARYFLDSEPITKGTDPRELAEAIQIAVEDWMEKNVNYD